MCLNWLFRITLVSSSTHSSLCVEYDSWLHDSDKTTILFCSICRHMLTVFAVWLLCVQIKNWKMSSTNWPSLLHGTAPSLKRWPWKNRRTTQSFPSCLAEITLATTSASSPWSNSSVCHWKTFSNTFHWVQHVMILNACCATFTQGFTYSEWQSNN